MRKLVVGFFVFPFILNSSTVFAGGGGGSEGDEISMVVLDDLFEKASQKWETTSDAVWEEYSDGKLTVKPTAANSTNFVLHSDSRGDLTLGLDGEMPLSKQADEKTVAKMRESFLLDTEELTDNEGGSEE